MKELYRAAYLTCGEKSDLEIIKDGDKYIQIYKNTIDGEEDRTEYKLVGNKLIPSEESGMCDLVVYGDILYVDEENSRFDGRSLMTGHFDKIVFEDYSYIYNFFPDGTICVEYKLFPLESSFRKKDGTFEKKGDFIRLNYEINTIYFWYHEGFIYTTIDVSEELLDKLIVFKDDLDANLVIEDNTRNTSDNILKQIYLKCPNIIKDRRLFKAYLSDYFYENKTLLNVLLLSFDEGIPQEIAQTKTNDSLLLARMKKKLIISYAISDSIADQVIEMWVEAILEKHH